MITRPARPSVALVPGRGERVAELARALRLDTGQASGIDLDGALALAPFAEQVASVRRLLAAAPAVAVGRSWGGWLLVHALLEAPAPFPGAVVLVSSVLGPSTQKSLGFVPPRTRRFSAHVAAGLPLPARAVAIVHAEDDGVCPASLAESTARAIGASLHLFPDGGHALGLRAHEDRVARLVGAMVDRTH